MPYTAPEFAWEHALRESLAASVSSNNPFTSDNPKELLLDNRAGRPAIFATSESDHYIDVDRGAGTLSTLNRTFVPAGHSFAGIAVQVLTDDNSGFSSAITQFTKIADADVPLDEAWGTPSSERYVRFQWLGVSGAWETPELIHTRRVTFTRGPDLEGGGAVEQDQTSAEVVALRGGLRSTVELGPPRKEIGVEWRLVNGTDLTELLDFVDDVGITQPFLYWRPEFGSDLDPVWCFLANDADVRYDIAVAQNGTDKRRISLDLIENRN